MESNFAHIRIELKLSTCKHKLFCIWKRISSEAKLKGWRMSSSAKETTHREQQWTMAKKPARLTSWILELLQGHRLLDRHIAFYSGIQMTITNTFKLHHCLWVVGLWKKLIYLVVFITGLLSDSAIWPRNQNWVTSSVPGFLWIVRLQISNVSMCY